MTKISNQYSLTNVLFADAVNGRVGIGTEVPATKLEVAGSVRAYVNSATTTELFAENSTVKVRLIAGTSSSFVSTATNHPLIFETNNAERMRITSGGRVGINQTSPGVALSVAGQSESWQLALTRGSGLVGAVIGSPSDNVLAFGDWSGTERMRITSVGDLLLGATSKASARMEFRIGGTSNGAAIILGKSGSSTAGFGVDTGYTPYWECYQTGVGVYVVNVTGGVVLNQGATSWSSASDINLKDISGNIDNALSKLYSLNGVNFTWKSDKDKVKQVGLIAQEVQEVLPEAVSTDRNNNLTVRYTEVIPLLVEAIKELSAQASEQQTQINELKALLNAQ